MTAPTFEDAVKIAKYLIAPNLIPPDSYDKQTLTRLAAWRGVQCDTQTNHGYMIFRAENYGAQMLLTAPDRLVENAKLDYFSFLALTHGLANILELGWPLPCSVRLWLVRYHRGEFPVPRRPRAQPRKSDRQLKIYCAVEYLVGIGMKPTRNEIDDRCQSACDAVALAHKEIGMAPRSYKRVLEIYAEEKMKSGNELRIVLSPELAELIQITSETTD